MDKTRILFCGASLSYVSGLSTILATLMRKFHLTGNYEVAYCSLSGDLDTTYENCFQAQDKEFSKVFNSGNLRIYNAQINKSDRAGNFDVAVLDFKPQIVISLHDPWIFESIAISHYRDSFCWFCYVTIETPQYPGSVIFPTSLDNTIRKNYVAFLEKADVVIPVTEMGKHALEKLGLTNLSDPIPLGINFDYVPKKRSTKLEAFGASLKEDDFVFMTMGRNNERKRIDQVVFAFYEFLQTVDSPERCKLYIHTNINEMRNGPDLMSMFVDLNLLKNIILPKSFLDQGQASDVYELYKRYSASDCYVGFPSGEGWGMGYAESIANKLPVIYIDYGGHVEYLNGIGAPVRVGSCFCAKNTYMKFVLPDMRNAVDVMKQIYSNGALRAKMREDGYKYAKENLDWDIVFLKFLSIIESFYRSFDKSNFKFNLKRIF